MILKFQVQLAVRGSKANNLKVSGSSSFYKDVEVKEFLKIM